MKTWIKDVPPASVLRVEYPALWLESERILPDLSDDDRARVVVLAVGTCMHCHAAGRDCQCWNDE